MRRETFEVTREIFPIFFPMRKSGDVESVESTCWKENKQTKNKTLKANRERIWRLFGWTYWNPLFLSSADMCHLSFATSIHVYSRLMKHNFPLHLTHDERKTFFRASIFTLNLPFVSDSWENICTAIEGKNWWHRLINVAIWSIFSCYWICE